MEEFEEDYLFEKGDMVLLTLKNGNHYLGEFACMDDLGVQLSVTAKTAHETVKEKKLIQDEAFENFVKNRVESRLLGSDHFKEKEWMDAFLDRFKVPIDTNVDFFDVKDAVIQSIQEEERAIAKSLWNRNVVTHVPYTEEQEVLKPFLKMCKKPVRTLVAWHKIDEMCNAEELVEDAQIKDFAASLENGEFEKMIQNMEDGNDGYL